MAIRCIVHFAQTHPEFRLPELESVAELFEFTFKQPLKPCESEPVRSDATVRYNWDSGRPFWIVDFESEAHIRLVCERCILVKAVYEHYASASNYRDLHEQSMANAHLYTHYEQSASFRFTVHGYNHSIPKKRVSEVIDGFRYMDWKGPVDLKTPEVNLFVFEEYGDRGTRTVRSRDEGDGEFEQVYFGRLISEGKARDLIRTFDVKKRSYYGNTSMEAEISLLMANQTLASPGKLIYDPFVGTGSMAYTVAHFGAYVFGSDIDGRQMRGKDTADEPGIMRAATQYGVEKRVLDLCTFDVTHNPLRFGGFFDAIITDPPYGVRAGAKRLGRKATDKKAMRDRDLELEEAQRKGLVSFIPPTQPYELSELISDLVRLARYLLKPSGRLVFFLPTVTDEYAEVDIEGMLCEGMVVVANSVQDFGSWGRRLITIKKITEKDFGPPSASGEDGHTGLPRSHVPAHKDFREKYFRGFRTEDIDNLSISEKQEGVFS